MSFTLSKTGLIDVVLKKIRAEDVNTSRTPVSLTTSCVDKKVKLLN